MDFNINHHVYVKLTTVGIAELERQHTELQKMFNNILIKFTTPKTDEDGWSRWQLHNLMSQLGSLCKMGCDLPFETNIRIDGE